MPTITIPIASGSYKHTSVDFDSQRCINLYPEYGNDLSAARKCLMRAPGNLLFTNIESQIAQGRGMYATSGGRLFAVVGNELSEVMINGNVIFRGALLTNDSYVSITDNGLELVVADGYKGYTMNLTTNLFQQITDTDFPANCPIVCFIDKFITAFNPEVTPQGQWQISDIADARTWDSLDIYNAEGNPDKIVSMIVNAREVWVFGTESTQVFYDTGGDVGNTFAPISGAFLEIGCGAVYSVAKMDGSIFWLGANKEGNNIIYRSNGYQELKISDFALDKEIARYANTSDAIAYTYQQDGHKFYVITFVTADKTWVYDLTTNEWHERNNLTVLTGVKGRSRIMAHAFFNNKNYGLDYANGNIYEISTDVYSDNLTPIICERTFPHFGKPGERLCWNSLEFQMQVGVGLTGAVEGSDPQISLQWSNDGGNTYGNLHSKSIGKIGEYNKRVKFNRLGQSRDKARVFKISFSDPVKIVIFDDCVAEVEQADG